VARPTLERDYGKYSFRRWNAALTFRPPVHGRRARDRERRHGAECGADLESQRLTAEVVKMKSAFGAPIADDQVPAIVDYLTANYGKP
jgi:hypothetical protein